jgi:uncharacterized protein YecE (DUF72 family)
MPRGEGQFDLFGEPPPPPSPPEAPSPSGLLPDQPHAPGFHVGTCAFTHEAWRGTFYPPGLPQARELAYYARFHNAVEIDASFYRVPTDAMVERWLLATPDSFVFALKAPQSLTHTAQLDLDSASAGPDWIMFLRAAERFGSRLAAILVQLPPSLRADALPRLARVLESVPPRMRVAVEMRHPTWSKPETAELLARSGAARVWTDSYLDQRLRMERTDPWLFADTGSFVYARLLGDISTKYNTATGGLRHQYGTVLFDRRDDIEEWKKRLISAKAKGKPVMIFINNHYQGFSPLTADEFRKAALAAQGPGTAASGT